MQEELKWVNRVREHRLRALVVTETELARRVNLSPSSISRIENQKVFLTAQNALRLAEVLNCGIGDLYAKNNEEGEEGVSNE